MTFDHPAPSSPFATPRRRAFLLAGAGIIAVLGYCLYWHAMADGLRDQFIAWKNRQKGPEVTLSHAAPDVRGFPFQFDLFLGALTYERKDSYRFSSPAFHIKARPWAPFRPVFSSEGKSTLTLAGQNGSYEIEKFSIRAVKPWLTPNSRRDTALYLYVDASGITLDPSIQTGLGRNIARLAFNAKIKGGVPDVGDSASLDAWRQAGNIVDLDKAVLEWGPLGVKGEGTATLDKNLQPLASFNAKLNGYLETIDLLRDEGQIKPMPASLFKAALTLLQDKKSPKDKPHSIAVPVNVQDSTLSVAGTNLLTWPPVKW